jgi:hypothetical protein
VVSIRRTSTRNTMLRTVVRCLDEETICGRLSLVLAAKQPLGSRDVHASVQLGFL